MPFPSTLSTFSRPTTTSKLNNPSHSALHNTVSSALGQVEAVIGLADSGSVLGTIIGDLRSAGSAGGGHVQTAVKGGTGQTTYTKGDILVAQSASVLAKLALGANGKFLTADSALATGVGWAGGNPTVRVYSNASTLTWVKPSVLAYIEIEMLAAGGGGGTHASGGGGGSGGTYIKGTIPASLLGTTEVIVVPGSIAGGTSGGNAEFSSILVARGGITAASGQAAGNSAGYSGTYISSVAAISSFLGSAGIQTTEFAEDIVTSGVGGDTPYGRGGRLYLSGVGENKAGYSGTGYGSGGGGGVGTGPGGMGSQGLIIIREY